MTGPRSFFKAARQTSPGWDWGHLESFSLRKPVGQVTLGAGAPSTWPLPCVHGHMRPARPRPRLWLQGRRAAGPGIPFPNNRTYHLRLTKQVSPSSP